MKTKLLLISESMGGGLRKHVLQIIENLDPDVFDIYFIHGTKNLDEEFKNRYEEIKTKATIFPCESFEREISPSSDFKSYLFVSKKIKQIKPDIVHCHSSKAGVVGRLAAKRNRVKKIIYTPHAYSFLAPEFSESKKRVFLAIEKFLARTTTTRSICVSQGEKKQALKHNLDNSHKIEVIYNGLPEIKLPSKNELKESLGFSGDTFIIGNNARFSEQKNPFMFLQIAKDVHKKDNSIQFVWAGDGPLFSEVKSYISENDMGGYICLLGDRKDSEIIVGAYDVFLTPALYEGLPYAPIEALRAGVPVVGSNVIGNNEIVNSEVNGFLFDCTNDVPGMIGMTNMLNKEQIIATFEEKFSLKKMIHMIENEYLGWRLN